MALNYYTYLQYAEEYENPYMRAMADFYFAYILVRMKRYGQAKEYYGNAIACLEQAEESDSQKKMLVHSMVGRGLCHLLLEETQEAYGLLGKVLDLVKAYPTCGYSEFYVVALQAACQNVEGKPERAILMAERLKALIRADEKLEELQGIIVTVLAVLTHLKLHERVEQLIELLDEMQITREEAVYMDIYPYRSKYLLDKNNIEEYISYTKDYMELYQQHRQENLYVTARILELQDKLSRVELERKDILEDNRKLESVAKYDSMTELANRTYLNEYLSRRYGEMLKRNLLLGLEIMDIDYFKEYNDVYGHLAGDECIVAVANVLKSVENKKVFCARYGGDEFVIVYNNMTVEEIEEVVEKIQSAVRALNIRHEGSKCDSIVTVSQGIYIGVPEAENREWNFNSKADIALYEAKQQGRNKYHIITNL